MEEFVMTFLDVGPMILALRTRPAEFEMDRGWLHHYPSRHRFQVDPDGNVRIETRCDCALLHVKREQGQELWNAFQTWQAAYWRPTAINRELARHFQEPSIWQRLYRGLKIIARQTFRHTGQSGIALVHERARLRLEGRLLSSGSNRNGSAPRLDALN